MWSNFKRNIWVLHEVKFNNSEPLWCREDRKKYLIKTAPLTANMETAVPKETLICVDGDADVCVCKGGEVSLVLTWLPLICTLMRLHEGFMRLTCAEAAAYCCCSDFLSRWMWKLKVKLISLVKLQGLSGVLVPRCDRVFMWMFLIDISSLTPPSWYREKKQAVFPCMVPVDFRRGPLLCTGRKPM